MYKEKGFTLTEMIIVLTLVAILALISIFSYRDYVMKSYRTDAMHTLLAMQLAQEKYRMSNTAYGELAAVWSGVTTTVGGHYTLAISNVGASQYTLTATAIGTQASDDEDGTSCSVLTLTYSNGTTTKTPTDCWFD